MNFDFDDPDDYRIGGEDVLDEEIDKAIFSINNEEYGIVPSPVPSKVAKPTWYGDGTDVDSRIEDALNEGWLIRHPYRMEITAVKDDGNDVAKFTSNAPKNVASKHSLSQIGELNIPIEVVKFHSNWTVHLPDGYTALLTQPLSRPNEIYTQFSGFIDFDNFPTATHAPTILETKETVGVKEGWPLFQVLPFKRDDMLSTAITREATEDEMKKLESENDYQRTNRNETSTDIDVRSK